MSEMGHCETCQHWRPFEGEKFRGDRTNLARDMMPREDGTVGLWRGVAVEVNEMGLCAKANADDGIVDPTSLAFAEDGSMYRAGLRTCARFGCVMHEAKREP